MGGDENLAILVMDTSGSMLKAKRMQGFGYFNRLIKECCVGVDKHYIGYGRLAMEYNCEQDLIGVYTKEHTHISSGLALAYDIISEKPVNVIKRAKLVILTDGDNCLDDNTRVVEILENLLKIGVEVHYAQAKLSKKYSALEAKISSSLEDFKLKGSLKVVNPMCLN